VDIRHVEQVVQARRRRLVGSRRCEVPPLNEGSKQLVSEVVGPYRFVGRLPCQGLS
jgi:hypothetical protein